MVAMLPAGTSYVLVALSALMACIAIMRLVRMQRHWSQRSFWTRRRVCLVAIHLLLAVGYGCVAGLLLPIFLPGLAVWVVALFAGALGLIAFVPAPAFYEADHLLTTRVLTAPLPASFAWLALLVLLIWLRASPPDQVMLLGWPVQGEWLAVSAGPRALTNHHQNNPPPQSFAVDLVCLSAPTAGQPVMAPSAATVVRVDDGWTSRGLDTAEGNFLILRTDTGIDVWLAHLQDGSISVTTGSRVSAGQQVARCGDTGSAMQPHLHIHAEQHGLPVPMLFGPERQSLVRGDRVTP